MYFETELNFFFLTNLSFLTIFDLKLTFLLEKHIITFFFLEKKNDIKFFFSLNFKLKKPKEKKNKKKNKKYNILKNDLK